jgi:hypothetical protein
MMTKTNEATRRQLAARCKALGVRLVIGADVVRIDAPRGWVIAVTECHSRDLYLKGWTKPEAYAELLDDLRFGLERCDDAECEHCPYQVASVDDWTERGADVVTPYGEPPADGGRLPNARP